MTIEITYLITLLFGAVGCVGGVLSISRNKKHDLQKDASITFELKALQQTLAEIKVEFKSAMESNGKMTLENHDEIIKLKADTKTAFMRIDELREAINK